MKSFTTVYRIGGTARFEWRRCVPVATKAEALKQRDEIGNMGYKALVFDTQTLDAVGMPEGWSCTEQGLWAHE
jgi:hypothetical protein